MYFSQLTRIKQATNHFRRASSVIETYKNTMASLFAQGFDYNVSWKDFSKEMEKLFWKPFQNEIDMQFYLDLLKENDEYSKNVAESPYFFAEYAEPTLKTNHAFLSLFLDNVHKSYLHKGLILLIQKYAPDFFKDEKYMLPFLLTSNGYNLFVIADHGMNKEYITDIRKNKDLMYKFLAYWGKGNVKEKNYLKKNFVHRDALWSMERDAYRRREERRLNPR